MKAIEIFTFSKRSYGEINLICFISTEYEKYLGITIARCSVPMATGTVSICTCCRCSGILISVAFCLRLVNGGFY